MSQLGGEQTYRSHLRKDWSASQSRRSMLARKRFFPGMEANFSWRSFASRLEASTLTTLASAIHEPRASALLTALL